MIDTNQNQPDGSVPFSLVMVDDDPMIRKATVRLLSKAGYTVAEAASGAEGKALIIETKPDLVLMDVELGDADGREICRSLRKNSDLANTFFVVVSGSKTSPDDMIQGLESGADGYIARPVENRLLLAQVRAFLRIATAEKGYAKALEVLEAKNDDITRFNKMAIGRELRMIKLKQEVNALARELGKTEPYPAQHRE